MTSVIPLCPVCGMDHGPTRHEFSVPARALLPFLTRYQDQGWPGLSERDRDDATNALDDLRVAVQRCDV